MIKSCINKVIAGDTSAYDEIISEYKQMVFAVAMQIVCDVHIAEDIAQETFVKAYLHLKKYKGESKFSTWLYRIAVNEALKVTKQKWFKNRKDSALDLPEDGVALNETGIEVDFLEHEDKKQAIAKTLSLLKPNESLVLHLFYLQEQSIAEVSEILNLKAEHVKVLLHRARKHFYSALKQEMKNELNVLR